MKYICNVYIHLNHFPKNLDLHTATVSFQMYHNQYSLNVVVVFCFCVCVHVFYMKQQQYAQTYKNSHEGRAVCVCENSWVLPPVPALCQHDEMFVDA